MALLEIDFLHEIKRISVDFFKAEAKKHHTSYQAMIRQLLDIYANQQRS